MEITREDYDRAAAVLGCGVAEIMAVAEVESKGDAFYADGFPVILFERHKFRKFTNGRYSAEHPDISGPRGGYGKAGANQRRKFSKAFDLDPIAAMKSCSWGIFQIMGFNYALCGFGTVGEFVDAMKESAGRQFDVFVAFVQNSGLADELRRKDFYTFAERYNGPDQEENRYSEKMEAAYKKFAKALKNSAAAPPKATVISEPKPLPAAPLTQGEPAVSPPPIEPPHSETVLKERPSTFTRWLTAIKVGIGTTIASVAAYCGGSEAQTLIANKAAEQVDSGVISLLIVIAVVTLILIAIGILLIWIASIFYDRSAERSNRLNQQKVEAAANPAASTVEYAK